jgi:hypothetical protein
MTKNCLFWLNYKWHYIIVVQLYKNDNKFWLKIIFLYNGGPKPRLKQKLVKHFKVPNRFLKIKQWSSFEKLYNRKTKETHRDTIIYKPICTCVFLSPSMVYLGAPIQS